MIELKANRKDLIVQSQDTEEEHDFFIQVSEEIDLETRQIIPNKYQVSILIQYIPPMGFKSFSVCQKNSQKSFFAPITKPSLEGVNSNEELRFANQLHYFSFSPKSGLLQSWENRGKQSRMPFNETLAEFSPNRLEGMELLKTAIIYTITGEVFDRIYTFHPNLVRIFTVYKTGKKRIPFLFLTLRVFFLSIRHRLY